MTTMYDRMVNLHYGITPRPDDPDDPRCPVCGHDADHEDVQSMDKADEDPHVAEFLFNDDPYPCPGKPRPIFPMDDDERESMRPYLLNGVG